VQGLPARGGGMTGIEERLRHLDWKAIEGSLWEHGCAKTPSILTAGECAELVALYGDDGRFRSRVDMARYGFGLGEYKYFAEPLPAVVQALRAHAYPYLAPIAGRFVEALGSRERFPPTLKGFLIRCARRGQKKPTPLLLRYEPGGYNCLHQDLYGEVEGGEFLLVEQRPRAQSRGEVVPLGQGEAVIFATRHRPAAGARGYHRTSLRHGVSRVISGSRYSLGVIFHNAK
jgi:uncharacterized protein